MLPRRLLAALILLSSALQGFGQEPVNLRHRFLKDSPIYQETTTESTQHMKVAGSDIKNVIKQTIYSSWTPVEQDQDGNWILKHKIEAVKVNMEVSGSPPFAFDSTKKDAGNNPLDKIYRAMVGSELMITIDRDMKVVPVEGHNEFTKDLPAGTAPSFNLFLISLPSHPVQVGDHWTQSHGTDMGPIGRIDETREYTYKGRGEDKLERIQVATLVKYAKPDPAAAGLPFKITKGDFKALNSNPAGHIKFDNRNGRVASVDLTLEWRGKLTIEVGGQTTDVGITQIQHETHKITGRDLPAEAGAPAAVQECQPLPAVYCQPCRCHHRLFHRWRRCR